MEIKVKEEVLRWSKTRTKETSKGKGNNKKHGRIVTIKKMVRMVRLNRISWKSADTFCCMNKVAPQECLQLSSHALYRPALYNACNCSSGKSCVSEDLSLDSYEQEILSVLK